MAGEAAALSRTESDRGTTQLGPPLLLRVGLPSEAASLAETAPVGDRPEGADLADCFSDVLKHVDDPSAPLAPTVSRRAAKYCAADEG